LDIEAEYGANVEAKDKSGKTSCITQYEVTYGKMVQWLIEHGVEPNG
jgi:hypothetical protein